MAENHVSPELCLTVCELREHNDSFEKMSQMEKMNSLSIYTASTGISSFFPYWGLNSVALHHVATSQPFAFFIWRQGLIKLLRWALKLPSFCLRFLSSWDLQASTITPVYWYYIFSSNSCHVKTEFGLY